MKYTEQQRQIVSLCRKYRDIKVEFKDAKTAVINGNEFGFYFGIAVIKQWLFENATLKSKSAPRQRKPAKVKRHIGLTAEQWEKVDAEAAKKETSCTAVINEIINKYFEEV